MWTGDSPVVFSARTAINSAAVYTEKKCDCSKFRLVEYSLKQFIFRLVRSILAATRPVEAQISVTRLIEESSLQMCRIEVALLKVDYCCNRMISLLQHILIEVSFGVPDCYSGD